jgi:hypothetical protein
MGRVVIIVVVWLAVLAGGGWLYVERMGDVAWARGADRYLYRITLARQIGEVAATRPDVVWMGGPTFARLRARSLIRGAPEAARPSGATFALMGYLGLTLYTFYPCCCEPLQRHPAVPVVAHLRLFSDPRDDYARRVRHRK